DVAWTRVESVHHPAADELRELHGWDYSQRATATKVPAAQSQLRGRCPGAKLRKHGAIAGGIAGRDQPLPRRAASPGVQRRKDQTAGHALPARCTHIAN